MTTLQVRRAVNAGPRGFYPSDPAELRKMLDGFFSQVPHHKSIDPLVLVCPHAGYIFSGQTAAHGYKLLVGKTYDRVIVLAPSHFAAFPGASIFDGDAFATPLGDLRLDREFITRLRQLAPGISYYPEAEAREHSLEVQLPFLKHALGDFLLVPIVQRDQEYENCEMIAQALGKALAGDSMKTLIVASSDLYHGPDHERALAESQQTAEALKRLDPRAFCEGARTWKYQACGAGPITTAMILAKEMGATTASLLDLRTSYDAYPGNEDWVVGYVAAAFHK
jgi:MEMO1 family protein